MFRHDHRSAHLLWREDDWRDCPFETYRHIRPRHLDFHDLWHFQLDRPRHHAPRLRRHCRLDRERELASTPRFPSNLLVHLFSNFHLLLERRHDHLFDQQRERRGRQEDDQPSLQELQRRRSACQLQVEHPRQQFQSDYQRSHYGSEVPQSYLVLFLQHLLRTDDWFQCHERHFHQTLPDSVLKRKNRYCP